jgi:hypothetical protein
MELIVRGVVRQGQVVLDAPLPEGVQVEVRLLGPAPELPPELLAEFEAWGRASDRALELVDGPAPEGGTDAAR